VTGGRGNDFASLGAGNDLFIRNNGDGDDEIEGGNGIDTLRFIGSAGADDIDVSGILASVSDDTDSVHFKDIERIEVRTLGGVDMVQVDDLTGTGVTAVVVDLAGTSGGAASDRKIDITSVLGTGLDDSTKIASVAGQVVVSGLAAQVSIVRADKTDILDIAGLAGDDTIDASKLAAGKVTLNLFGGIGADTLIGSAGDDFVLGGTGNDLAFLGAGNDLVHLDAGDGSDTVEGGAGIDTLQLFGSDVAENFDIFANGGRALLFRDVDNATMDLNDVERIRLEALGGTDNITVGDLTGTDVKLVTIDLSAFVGGGDLAKDTVTVSGTNGNDKVQVTAASGGVLITGLASQVSITDGEIDKDTVTINAFGGNDIVDASKLPAGVVPLTLDGGGGNDTLAGGGGPDTLFGRDGNDVLSGGKSLDTLRGGSGNDLFLWGLGDGGDIVEGEGDIDTIRFTGSKLDDFFVVSAVAALTRVSASDGANLVINDVERLEIRALAGADSIIIGDLAGTDVTQIAVDLAATAGGKTADTKADTVSVLGTLNGNTTVTSLGGKVVVTTDQGPVTIDHWGKGDVLVLSGNFGNEVLDASALAAKSIELHVVAGLGADTVFGSAGNDQVSGGSGNDEAQLGAGNDLFTCQTGDGSDIVYGQAGTDTFKFAAVAGLGSITIARDLSAINVLRLNEGAMTFMDEVERIELAGQVGSDLVTVENLAGTDVKQVAIDFGSAGGTKGDAVYDSAALFGGDGNEMVTIALSAGVLSAKGLATQVTIAHAESIDSLFIHGKGGNDTITAATVPLTAAEIQIRGGEGNDRLTGNLAYNAIGGDEGNDTLSGGGGNDDLEGGDGNDKIDGGTGNDIVRGDAGSDYLVGGTGDDQLFGGAGSDTITGGTGNDRIVYTDVLDGHDVVLAFDGNAAGGQDVLDLGNLFTNLSVPLGDRAARVSIVDSGASVEIAVDTNGDLTFDLAVATLKTADAITIGQDILLGG